MLVWRAAPASTLILAVLTLVSAVLPLGIAYAGKGIVDAVVAHSESATVRWVLIELGIVTLQAIVQRTLGLTRQLLGARLSLDINVMILDKALTLELRHFEDGQFYDSLTRARREASFRPVSVVTDGFQLVQNLLTLIGYFALIVRYSPWAALALFTASVPAAVVEMYFSRSAFRLRNWRAPESRQLNYLEYVIANDSHVKEVKLFGLGRTILGRYKALAERIYKEDQSLAGKRAGWALVLSLVGTGAYYLCYAGMALAAALGRMTLGNLTLYLVAFRQGQQAFQSVLAAIGGLYEHTLYMSNLFEYLAIPVTNEAPRPAPDHPAPETGSGELGIRFDDVGFKYPAPTPPPANGSGPPRPVPPPAAAAPAEDKWVLRHVSFFVPRGQSVALVGQNGAGKTTLIKLLTRLYHPTEGRVLIDGVDLRDWDPDKLRARVGVIFQDFNEYQFDVRDNVGVGSLAHLTEQDRIVRATERGGADQVVAGLPEGYATRLGKWAHDGVELSGGQWQKIALARAFMREEADILVLDEPTAALDAEAEHAIFERFRTLAAGRTTFLISHRFSTVRIADRILVLEGGRVTEDGSHAQLVQAGARYAHLFQLQAQGYLS
ncbi:MAG TPA: ABC transporter ATP-binding protein [Kofleriaceae bacterium]|nr:ABC transporter ATP-binding protein [Kofleriaceae bacterium]